jgi:hypothetical protein
MLGFLRAVNASLPLIRDILSGLEVILLQILATILVIRHFLPRKAAK